jgi:hypothetical protein
MPKPSTDTRNHITDSARLDWLERMANKPGGLLLHDGTEQGRCGLGLRPGLLKRTLREAIDAAMGADPNATSPAPQARPDVLEAATAPRVERWAVRIDEADREKNGGLVQVGGFVGIGFETRKQAERVIADAPASLTTELIHLVELREGERILEAKDALFRDPVAHRTLRTLTSELQSLRAALSTALADAQRWRLEAIEGQQKQCQWVYDDVDGFYQTSCGNAFWFDTGTPAENKAKFCCYCGAALSASTPREGGP